MTLLRSRSQVQILLGAYRLLLRILCILGIIYLIHTWLYISKHFCTNTTKIMSWAPPFVWTANILGIVYNIPQIHHTYQTKKVDDISTTSLILRLVSSVMWSFYCVYFSMWDVGASWFITLSSSILIAYYKIFQQIQKENVEMGEIV